MLTRDDSKGQYLKASDGFSLIEVMIAAGLLAALSHFGMELLDQMRRNQKGTELRFEAFSIVSEGQGILTSSLNCLETFKDIDIKKLDPWDQNVTIPLEIKSLKKVYLLNNSDKEEASKKIIDKFQVSGEKENFRYNGLKIHSYALVKEDEDLLEKNALEGQLHLQIAFDLGESSLLTKRIPVSFVFDEDEKLVSCRASGFGQSSGSGGSTLILDPIKQDQFKNKAGNEACQELKKNCQFVSSLNYASEVYGNQMGLSNLCQISYNKSLNGAQTGSPLTNIHSCEVKLGQFETYRLSQKDFGVTCQGIFMAHCQ